MGLQDPGEDGFGPNPVRFVDLEGIGEKGEIGDGLQVVSLHYKEYRP